jgi:hypothetical protein
MVLAVAASLLPATAAWAQIEFTPVVDTTNTPFERFGSFPSLSKAGHVAFYAERGTTYTGLFQTILAGTPITTIADSEGPFSVLDAFTSINSAGQVAFTGILQTGEAGVFKWSNSMVSTVSQPDGTFLFFGGAAQINDGGTVAFFATRAPAVPVVRGIYAGDGTAPVMTVADNSGTFRVFGDSPAINATGSVVFFATDLEATDAGLYRGTATGGPTAPILTNNSSPLHNFERDPSVNAFGRIAFKAVEDSTSMPGLFLVDLDGTGLTTLLTTNGPFSQFDSPTINDNGTVAFLGFLDNGGLGIFTGANPVGDKVIGRGDLLFGSTVTALGFYRGLNDNDQLAFSYELANGRTGVAIANLTPIPEPSTLILTCAAGIGVACAGRRRLLFAYRTSRKTKREIQAPIVTIELTAIDCLRVRLTTLQLQRSQ